MIAISDNAKTIGRDRQAAVIRHVARTVATRYLYRSDGIFLQHPVPVHASVREI